LADGKAIENPGEITFAKSFTKNMAKFAVVAAGSNAACTKWVRFPEFYLTDYFYMNTRYWDAVVFVPKRNVMFFGFGVMANYNGKDMKIKVQWNVGETDS